MFISYNIVYNLFINGPYITIEPGFSLSLRELLTLPIFRKSKELLIFINKTRVEKNIDHLKSTDAINTHNHTMS